MNSIFSQFAVIMTLSCLFGYVALRLRLPLVVAYLLAGVALSSIQLVNPTNAFILNTLPEIGIAFVVFLIGMALDLREIKVLGKPIVISTLGQVFISSMVGYCIARLLGFNALESVYLGLGLSFSSTVVILKMLLEKRELVSLFGKLSLGITLAEDLVAIIVLMIISLNGGSSLSLGFYSSLSLAILGLKGIELILLTYLLSRYVLEKIFAAVAKSTELLFFTAITWCFVFTSFSVLLGFSVVVGAFLAGIALASSPYHFEIQGKVKPLRDFFLTLFFVYLGSQVKLGDILVGWPVIILFTVFAIIAKPLIYMLLLGLFGFRKHTLFQTCLNLSQVSEFSLIILVFGVKLGIVSQLTLSVMASVGVLSIICSTILISSSRKLYRHLAPFIRYFEHKTNAPLLEIREVRLLEDHIVVIGANRVGGPIVEYLKKAQIPFIVMDFNPTIVSKLNKEGVAVLYGDIGDPEILDNLQIEKAKLIISTANYLEDNELLIKMCKRRKSRATIVVRTDEKTNVERLKLLGADYVIVPEKVSGTYMVEQIKTHWPNPHFVGMN